MLRSDIVMGKLGGLIGGKSQYFFYSLRMLQIRNIAGVKPGTDLFFYFTGDIFKIDSHFAQYVHRNTLPQFYYAKQNVFRAYIIVLKAYCLLPGKRQYLLCSWCELLHSVRIVKFYRILRFFSDEKFCTI